MDVSDAKRLKGLEGEKARLKRLLADAMLDHAALKDILGKVVTARREAASGRASGCKLRDERTAGVPDNRLLPDDHALRGDPPG